MIKTSLLIFLNCLLFSNLVYGSTEIKPPNGPFVSMLRATFSETDLNTVTTQSILKGTLETEQKEYNFQVPDLGRYSARPNNINIDTYQEINMPTKIMPFNNSLQQQQAQPENAFDSLPIETRNQENPFSSSFNVLSRSNTPKSNQSFDQLPIARPQNGENGFYPPEWAQINPLRPLNRAPKNNSNTNFLNPNSMTGMPFSNQSPPRYLGNQTNNGYQ